jgi:hypothetical protein
VRVVERLVGDEPVNVGGFDTGVVETSFEASGRLPTLVSAAPTMAYLPLIFDIKSSGENRWSDRLLAYRKGPQPNPTFPLSHHANISNLHLVHFRHHWTTAVNFLISRRGNTG